MIVIKFLNISYKSDKPKLYMKIIDLDEIYNFVVDKFFILYHLDVQIFVINFIAIFTIYL